MIDLELHLEQVDLLLLLFRLPLCHWIESAFAVVCMVSEFMPGPGLVGIVLEILAHWSASLTRYLTDHDKLIWIREFDD